jgi:hypothetical protein
VAGAGLISEFFDKIDSFLADGSARRGYLFLMSAAVIVLRPPSVVSGSAGQWFRLSAISGSRTMWLPLPG